MATNKLENVKARLRKLLALAGSANENEAALALQRAQKLAQDYQLDLNEVHADPSLVTESETLLENDAWFTTLLGCVAKAFSCELLCTSDTAGYIIGRKDNVTMCLVAWPLVRSQIFDMYKAFLLTYMDTNAITEPLSVIRYVRARNSYRDGVLLSLSKLVEDQRNTWAQGDGKSLIVVLEEEMHDYMTKRGVVMHTIAIDATMDEAYMQGAKDGQALRLQKGLEHDES